MPGFSNLYLLKYNNFFNKIVRKEESLQDYLPYQVGDAVQRVNFIPNDYLTTEQVINWDYENPDYVLVTDEDGEITSRWFVTTTQRTRAGQLKLTLQRDVLADYRDDVMAARAYIRRAMLPTTNPLIYNSEGMQFNQIKTREDLLYDKTKTPWIVGYVDIKATDLQGATIQFQGDDAPLTNFDEIIAFSSTDIDVISGNPTIQFTATPQGATSGSGIFSKYSQYTYSITPDNTATIIDSKVNVNAGQITARWVQTTKETAPIITNITNNFKGKGTTIKNSMSTTITGLHESNTYQQYNGKIVYDGTNRRYYQIAVKSTGTGSKTIVTSSTNNPALYESLRNIITAGDYIKPFAEGGGSCTIIYKTQTYKLTLQEVSYGDYSVTLHDTARVLQDAPYRMFAMPYTEQNYQLAINLNTNNGTKFYDIQILPYCPVQNYYDSTGSVLLTGLVEGKDYEKITQGAASSTVLSYLFWCTTSTFTFDIPYTVTIGDVKIDNECDMYRLCSPNGNGSFEFNAARNGGVTYINVDCTYRPFDPYIHLNPNFDNLYGQDFNDFRGLVLNGDFSIPALNDQWVQYTINNKNYQNIFNREIQSLELQNKVAASQDWLRAIVGAFSGGAAIGGGIGIATGNLGAGLGAGVVGAIGSGIAGGFDIYYNRKLREDQLNLKRDLFSYNLQNIQALPMSVSKTGCLTNNNKLVPYIEYYTCTQEEKQILADKIKYEGMTVGATGLISDYVAVGAGIENPMYIEADIIEIPLNLDYNLTMQIVNELRGGVRIA